MKEVADRLGVTSGAVTNQLAGRQFSTKMAKRYAEEFGFNQDYLLFGRGALLAENEPDKTAIEIPFQIAETMSRMSATILSQQQTIAQLVNEGATIKPPHHCEGSTH